MSGNSLIQCNGVPSNVCSNILDLLFANDESKVDQVAMDVDFTTDHSVLNFNILLKKSENLMSAEKFLIIKSRWCRAVRIVKPSTLYYSSYGVPSNVCSNTLDLLFVNDESKVDQVAMDVDFTTDHTVLILISCWSSLKT